MTETFAFAGFSTSALELISFVLAMITVLLNIRQNHWAWLFAILSSATYSVVFFDARLYGDAGLQLVFIAVSVWGWYQWLGGVRHQRLVVTRLDRTGLLWSAGAWLGGFALLAYFLRNYTNTNVPHIDGFLTAGSILGQLLLSRKKLENWIVWIAVDVLYVGLYVYQGLTLTAILYAIFCVMAVIGLRTWARAAVEGAR